MTEHIDFDLRDFQRAARGMGAKADQVPFALARAMNDAARIARGHLVEDVWPSAVQVRNKGFMRQALTTEFATKTSLSVTVYDRLRRANLSLHADGGTRAARNRNLAIPPDGSVRRGAQGVPKSQRPRAVVASTPKHALRITPRGIFVGQDGELRLKFSLTHSAQIKPDVPFRRGFEMAMRSAIGPAFKLRLADAMKTRRPR